MSDTVTSLTAGLFMSAVILAPSLLNTLMTQRIQKGMSVQQALVQIETQAQSGELNETITAYDRALEAITLGIQAAAERATGG